MSIISLIFETTFRLKSTILVILRLIVNILHLFGEIGWKYSPCILNFLFLFKLPNSFQLWFFSFPIGKHVVKESVGRSSIIKVLIHLVFIGQNSVRKGMIVICQYLWLESAILLVFITYRIFGLIVQILPLLKLL